jgi:hypothetical protein
MPINNLPDFTTLFLFNGSSIKTILYEFINAVAIENELQARNYFTISVSQLI